MISDGYYWFLLGSLGVWRIAHFLYAEDGPADIVVHLRRRAGAGGWGKLLDCFNCLSIWIAAPFAALLGRGWKQGILLWPALSAGAIVIQRLAGARVSASPARYLEDPEEEDDLLRERPRAAPRRTQKS